jgi:ABC-type multidrug transport system fused ATPase/permease subunit
MRLDFLGVLLTLAVALLTVGTRFTISPGQTGVVLSYILTVQQVLLCHSLLFILAVDDLLIQSFGLMVRQVAEVENNMNAVERVVHYAKELEQEAPHEIEDSPAASNWPSRGNVVMKDVVMRYRPELPPVLKGLSMSISPGEKIGVVGRRVSPVVFSGSYSSLDAELVPVNRPS